jgi:predicted ATP-grasp superfamily ATP-dependent carboligase
LAEPDSFLVVALSGRALAVAIRRSGRRARVIDLFGDTDTRASAEASMVVAGDFDRGFDEAALLEAAAELAPANAEPLFGLVYSSGLESRPDVLARLARGRRLFGNTPEVVARTKSPREFFELLWRLKLPHPEVRFERPADPSGWLSKGVGGSGGGHVRRAREGAEGEGQLYFQRRVAGRPIGVSFVANGHGARIIGCNEQWVSADDEATEFRFGGTLQPAVLSPAIARLLPEVVASLVPALGLVGLNSLDIMVEGDEFRIIEVNPRPGANLDIYDHLEGMSLFALHVAACQGDLPATIPALRMATAMSVIYAREASLVPAAIDWPPWVADRPAPGARIDPGAPICTVLDVASSAEAARQAITAKTAWVRSVLHPLGQGKT